MAFSTFTAACAGSMPVSCASVEAAASRSHPRSTAFTKQIVDRAMAKVGLTGDQLEACYAELRGNPGSLQNALSHLLQGRDVGPFQALGRDWLARNERVTRVEADRSASQTAGRPDSGSGDTMEATLRAAGFETSVTRQGALMVKAGVAGTWVPASALLQS